MKEIIKFEETIGVTFKDKELLKTALTHRSYVNENRGSVKTHNERLEFLGDAVLELIVTTFLFEKFPERAEGELTAFRSSLVNTDSLASVANTLNINDFVLLSKGERKDTGRARHYILANATEAVIGAIYLDQGYEAAQVFILTNITPQIDAIVESGAWIDAKSLFQSQAQEHEGVTPTYAVIRESGPDHNRHFVVGVFLGEELVAKGEGKAKQEAEQVAAQEALGVKDWEGK
jgi:ribonuclease III